MPKPKWNDAGVKSMQEISENGSSSSVRTSYYKPEEQPFWMETFEQI